MHQTAAELCLPPGSWDAHTHLFDPARFPYKPDRAYTPEPASLDMLLAAEYAQNVMIVQASVEASPEGLAAHLAEARQNHGDRHFRGTMAAPADQSSAWHLEKLSDAYLRSLHDLGVRNIRIAGANGAGSPGADSVEFVLLQLRSAAASYAVRELGWSISAQLPLKMWAALAPHVDSIIGVSLIADHDGSVVSKDIGTPELATFLELLAAGKLHVKLGALQRRVLSSGGDLNAMRDVVRAIAGAAPGGIVWGSDWPHVNVTQTGLEPGPPMQGVDTVTELKLMREWLTDEQWMGMMVKNPARLFR
ncbi:hypothetical protein Micbo1qcDRAFT_126327 [Microdochium bolleyi]|uniref:Amidohydrolase-related domain-containing protein n=1 Tax=Microdochium bolleyi TaxID=196109 RepID=A0A136INY3_9PEZI|nr:hypothetical protein Micbo1qcDRAFT_126327 [Microdochium bolleyi]